MGNVQQPAGFLAAPSAGSGPGVLVLHAWWGLNETVREVCQRLADGGFVAFAPDLYRGELATTIPEAEALSEGLDGEQARADVARAAEFLSERADPSAPLAVIGFSLGAYYAVALSTSAPDRVGAVVLFYGVGEGDFARSQASYLGHFAENDTYESPTFVHWLENELRSAGRPVIFHHYPNTGHWFFERDRTDAYDEAAATLAWDRTLAFLKQQQE